MSTYKLWLFSVVTVLIACVICIIVIEPIWIWFSPPFQHPQLFPRITAPVDGPFYLRNAENGYQWQTRDPLSLWFHPLLSVIISALPIAASAQLKFWLICVCFSVPTIVLVHKLLRLVVPEVNCPPYLLLLILIVPAGLSVATGNAEIPTLFFNLLLLINVLHYQSIWLSILIGGLAILMKPNALYMVPVLLIYAGGGYLEKKKGLWITALLGAISILIVWVVWIGIVDWQTGVLGSYWTARESARQYVAGGVGEFFDHLVRSFMFTNDLRDQIRYSTALIIPLVNLLIIGMIPFLGPQHRYAFATGNLAMLVIALSQGNPNKIIVYTTTLPSHFCTYLMFIIYITKVKSRQSFLWKLITIGLVGLYCGLMNVIYVLGTALGWYF